MANPNPSPSTRFKPGQSGNPAGSSKNRRLTSALLRQIEERGLDDQFINAGLTAAMSGDFRFWSYIYDRIDGRMGDSDKETADDIDDLLRDDDAPGPGAGPPAQEV